MPAGIAPGYAVAIVAIAPDFYDCSVRCTVIISMELVYQKIEWEYLANSPGIASDDVYTLREAEFNEAVEEGEWNDYENDSMYAGTSDEKDPDQEDFS